MSENSWLLIVFIGFIGFFFILWLLDKSLKRIHGRADEPRKIDEELQRKSVLGRLGLLVLISALIIGGAYMARVLAHNFPQYANLIYGICAVLVCFMFLYRWYRRILFK